MDRPTPTQPESEASHDTRRTLGFALLGVGLVLLLARIGGGTGWLWLGLVAIAFGVAYVRERRYGFLVFAGVLSGIAVGQLLEGSWGWNNAFLVSLGIGIAAIDRVEPRDNRWPLAVGGVLIGLGILAGVLSSGVLTSALLPLLLIAGGAAVLWRSRHGRRDDWVRVPPPTRGAPAEPPAPSPAPPREKPAAVTPERPDAAPETGTTEPAAPAADDGAGANASPTNEEVRARDDDTLAARRAALERWRERRAEREGRTPGTVLPDSTLDNVARAAPRDAGELAEVSGVGPVTLERYGEEMLTVVAEVGGERNRDARDTD